MNSKNESTYIVEAQPVEIPTLWIDKTKHALKELERFKREIATPDDYQTIRGKPWPTKSFSRKMGLSANLRDEIVEKERIDRQDESFVWFLTVRVTAPNGRFCTAVGACDSRERNFNHVEHDVFATAHTRAKNRAILDMVGGGMISAEEIESIPSEESASHESSAIGNESLSGEKIIDTVQGHGLETDGMEVSTENGQLIVLLKGYVGRDLWDRYDAIMRQLGLAYTKPEGKDRGFWGVIA